MPRGGKNRIIVVLCVPVVKSLVGVKRRKHIGNANVFRTFVFLGAVFAGGAGDKLQTFKNLANLIYRRRFFFL